MLSNKKGMTLIEVMVVLAILAGLLVALVPRIKKGQNDMKKTTRELSVLAKDIRNESRMKNITHRLVFDLDSRPQKYWIESANNVVLLTADAEKQKEQAEKDRDKGKSKFKDDEDKAPPLFQKTGRFFKKDRALPTDMAFARVETATRGVATEGLAYIYFFPQGLVEKAAVQITDHKNTTWTLIFNPLTGHADIIDKAAELKDLQIE